MRRFSKLKKRIESLFLPDINLEIRCTCYGYIGWAGYRELPRFWITLNKEIIFDFIKDFGYEAIVPDPYSPYLDYIRPVYYSDIESINNLIQEYIETPVNTLFNHVFDKDYFGLTDILKAADRRIGKNRLLVLKEKTQSEAVKKVIDKRFILGGIDKEIIKLKT